MGLKGKIFKFLSDILKDGSYYKLYTQAKSTSACGLPKGFFSCGGPWARAHAAHGVNPALPKSLGEIQLVSESGLVRKGCSCFHSNYCRWWSPIQLLTINELFKHS